VIHRLSPWTLLIIAPEAVEGRFLGSVSTGMAVVLTVKLRQPSHEFTFSVGMNFISYPLAITPLV
jgi:hypothetical protein